MLLNFERSFRTGIITLFVFNVVLTTTAMIMIEKMVPTHSADFNKLSLQRDALATLLFDQIQPSTPTPELTKTLESAKLILVDDGEWAAEQEADLALVRSRLNGELAEDNSQILQSYQSLLRFQHKRITDALNGFRTMGLAGAWSVGSMSLLALLYLYYFYQQQRATMLRPLKDLVQGLQDWANGNRQRRISSARVHSEIQETFNIVNEMLDDEGPNK